MLRTCKKPYDVRADEADKTDDAADADAGTHCKRCDEEKGLLCLFRIHAVTDRSVVTKHDDVEIAAICEDYDTADDDIRND